MEMTRDMTVRERIYLLKKQHLPVSPNFWLGKPLVLKGALNET